MRKERSIMEFTEGVEKFKELRKISFEKPSDCKHCCAVSAGVMGVDYACMNKNYKGYGMQLPLCFDCEGYKKEEQETAKQ